MAELVGKVYLVGAGPGDPGLLTLRGAECLRSADVVIYDYLAAQELLVHSRRGCELICLGRHGQGRIMSQTEINAAMVSHATAGRQVVRLKGGDPTIFARLAEEVAALEEAGISYEIVPGVTAAQAASSYAGIPLTQRDDASCVAFVTGHETPGKESSLDYAALAAFPGTLVFYMGVTTAPVWSRALLDRGKRPDTPVAIARRCSLPDQETFRTTLGDLSGFLQKQKVRPPAMIIVGDVARQATNNNWFTARPLFGRTVLVTRPEHQSEDVTNRLGILGANVLHQPAIAIGPPNDWSVVDRVIARIDEFDWLVFSSANGVAYFFDRLHTKGLDARSLGKARLAAIGPATAAALTERHLIADFQPELFRAESLAEALGSDARGRRFFLARASRGREVLAEMLKQMGGHVEQAIVYESIDVPSPDDTIKELLDAGRVDWITVTSSAIARSLAKMLGDSLTQSRLAAISPLTAETLADLGYPPAAIAETYTAEGLVEAILHAERR